MSLTTSSTTDETQTKIDDEKFQPAEGHYGQMDEPVAATSDFFASVPSEYIDSVNILPDSDSLEHLNNFFDETTSTTPAENADNLIRCASNHSTGETRELETLDETQIEKFIKNLCTTTRKIALTEINLKKIALTEIDLNVIIKGI